MEPDKNSSPDAASQPPKNDEPQAPVDALSLTPDELQKEQSEQAAANPSPSTPTDPTAKKVSPLKKFFKKINVYLLIFIILVVVAAAIAAVNYLNSQKAPVEPTIASQELTEDALKDLANTDASVGSASQTLTIQGNAIISGQTLMRGNLNVAGNIQSGGSIQGPSLTISGASNLGQAQINSLQVATNVAVQGSTTLRDLNVAGTSSFSGPITASQITVTRIIMSGNAVLQIPNHISFTGASPSRTANASVLGSGGTASINGSDTTGTVSINTGNNPTPGCFVRVNFQQSFSNAAHVLISPVGAGAGATDYYVDRNNSGFSICTVNASPANQAFAFDYFVTN
ncbi:MAG: hypothetical protein JWN28_311 [Candidatus Saccharibacteria bacterium]|nr:hypothetical protein [Candidatus Saccharibacteria bacterium]